MPSVYFFWFWKQHIFIPIEIAQAQRLRHWKAVVFELGPGTERSFWKHNSILSIVLVVLVVGKKYTSYEVCGKHQWENPIENAWGSGVRPCHLYINTGSMTQILRLCTSVPTMLCCAVLEVLTPRKDSLFPEATAKFLLNHNLRLLPGYFGFLISRDQKERRGISFLAGVIDSDHQREIRLLTLNRSRKEYMWDSGDSHRQLLITPYLIVT